jgi:hypothetical protein
MCQKQGDKGLKIDQQGPAGSIAFAESKIKKRQLHGKQYGDKQQFPKLTRFDVKRSSGHQRPYKNRYGGDAETEAGGGKNPQT